MGRRAGFKGNNFTTIDAYYAAAKKGINSTDLYQIPEDDNWLYYQKHNNGSMVYAKA